MGRSEGEVDIVLIDHKFFKPKWCVEVKWFDRYIEKVSELSSLTFFCIQNQLKAALVTTISEWGNRTDNDVNLSFVPAALYAYNIGDITLKQKSEWLNF
jgi:hypothetical protein